MRKIERRVKGNLDAPIVLRRKIKDLLELRAEWETVAGKTVVVSTEEVEAIEIWESEGE